jgi:hypothetical protein
VINLHLADRFFAEWIVCRKTFVGIFLTASYSRIFYPKPARVENFSFQIDIIFVLVNFLEKELRNRQF